MPPVVQLVLAVTQFALGTALYVALLLLKGPLAALIFAATALLWHRCPDAACARWPGLRKSGISGPDQVLLATLEETGPISAISRPAPI